MSFFVPTTTANFNNIFSSESISPRSFYSGRRYGYRHFASVPPNDDDEVIKIYDKCPVYSLESDDAEASPLVIEIDESAIGEDAASSCATENGMVVYCVRQTIYFKPGHVRFLFCGDEEIYDAVISSEKSIETKLVGLYQNDFATFDALEENEKFIWGSDESNQGSGRFERQPCNKECDRDEVIDRVKGFLYGYVIGANRYVGERDERDLFRLTELTERLHQSLSVCVNKKEVFGDAERDVLGDVNRILKRRYLSNRSFGALEEMCDRLLGPHDERTALETDVDTFLEAVESLLRDALPSTSKEFKQEISAAVVPMFEGSSTVELSSYMESLHEKMKSSFSLSRIGVNEMPRFEIDRCAFVPGCPEWFVSLLSQIIFSAGFADAFLMRGRYSRQTERPSFVFATECTRYVAGAIGEEDWAGSAIQHYLNGLRESLKGQNREFSLQEIGSLPLRSFAAFCKKASKDNIDEGFPLFLLFNRVGDARIAFALWGAVYGFSALPKTVTNELFIDSDEYAIEVHRYVDAQLAKAGLLDSGDSDDRQSGEENDEVPIVCSCLAAYDAEFRNPPSCGWKTKMLETIPVVIPKRFVGGNRSSIEQEIKRIVNEQKSPEAVLSILREREHINECLVGPNGKLYKELKKICCSDSGSDSMMSLFDDIGSSKESDRIDHQRKSTN